MYATTVDHASQPATTSIISAALLALFILSGCSSPLSQTDHERSIEGYHRSDDTRTWRHADAAEIGLAQIEARRRWPEFVRAYRQWTAVGEKNKYKEDALAKEDCFEVKIPVTLLFATEHIWMHVTALDKDTVTGKLDAAPIYLRIYQKDSSFTVPISSVEDWVYGHDECPTGAFTTAVLRKCKLQEWNHIVLQDGQPTEASVLACNAAWEKLDRKWQGMDKKSLQKPLKDDEKEQGLWIENLSTIDDATRALQNTNPNACSNADLATACGLSMRTIQLIHQVGDHLSKQADKAK